VPYLLDPLLETWNKTILTPITTLTPNNNNNSSSSINNSISSSKNNSSSSINNSISSIKNNSNNGINNSSSKTTTASRITWSITCGNESGCPAPSPTALKKTIAILTINGVVKLDLKNVDFVKLSCYRVCHVFRLMKRDHYFWVDFDLF